jgi:uncharacterized membrane protein
MPHPQANQKSALGLDANVAALLGYLFWPLAVVNLIIEKDNQFVRFHAVQDLFFFLFWMISFFVLFIFFFILSFIIMIIGGMAAAAAGEVGGILGLIVSIIAMLIWTILPLLFVLILFAGIILCCVKAFQGEAFKLPIVGRLASKIVPI